MSMEDIPTPDAIPAAYPDNYFSRSLEVLRLRDTYWTTPETIGPTERMNPQGPVLARRWVRAIRRPGITAEVHLSAKATADMQEKEEESGTVLPDDDPSDEEYEDSHALLTRSIAGMSKFVTTAENKAVVRECFQTMRAKLFAMNAIQDTNSQVDSEGRGLGTLGLSQTDTRRKDTRKMPVGDVVQQKAKSRGRNRANV